MSDTSSTLFSNAVQQQLVDLSRASVERIQHCVDQLSPEQIWWRPGPGQNSIGNLLAHVTGNLQQWVVDGIPQQANERDRPAEFDELRVDPPDELIDTLKRTVQEAESVILSLSPGQFMEPRCIQGFNVTVLGVATHSVTHLVGHTHQIVTLTRLQLGESYHFQLQPDEPRRSTPL